MDGREPDVRIGDRDREAVSERLQQAYVDGVLTLAEHEERVAACWAARTRGDLAALTRDLPAPSAAAAPLAPKPQPMPKRRHRAAVVAALAGALVVGGAALAVRPLATADARTTFGSTVVDVPADEDRVDVSVLFGSVEVVVDDGVRARTEGGLAFGSVECEAACAGPGPAEVTVAVHGGFGSVSVVSRSEADADGGD